jgi:hypothetical protein
VLVSLSGASDQPITLAWSTQPPRDARAADRLSELFAASPAETPGDYLAQAAPDPRHDRAHGFARTG